MLNTIKTSSIYLSRYWKEKEIIQKNFFDQRHNDVRKRQALQAKLAHSHSPRESRRTDIVPTPNSPNIDVQQPDAILYCIGITLMPPSLI